MVMDGFYDLIKSRFIGRSPKLSKFLKRYSQVANDLEKQGRPYFPPAALSNGRGSAVGLVPAHDYLGCGSGKNQAAERRSGNRAPWH
jgi:hypothetical protein